MGLREVVQAHHKVDLIFLRWATTERPARAPRKRGGVARRAGDGHGVKERGERERERDQNDEENVSISISIKK